MGDHPSNTDRSRVSFSGIPSALDELQIQGLIRDIAAMEEKGVQLRGTQTELARVFAHLSEIILHNALAESRIRDIAHRELTEGEYAIFVRNLNEYHEIHHQANLRILTTGYGQLHDNVAAHPIQKAEKVADDVLDTLKGLLFPWLKKGR